MTEERPARINCVFIAGGLYHDFDYARLEILKLLGEDARIRTRVFEDYANVDAICAADFLITYTCDVVPLLHVQEALRDWVKAGGRWYQMDTWINSTGSGKPNKTRHAFRDSSRPCRRSIPVELFL